MSGKVWYQLADGEEHTKLYLSLDAAKDSLNRMLDTHRGKGQKVRLELVEGGEHPLWIVEHGGEIIAKYRLIENT